jgi:hypothetical protein
LGRRNESQLNSVFNGNIGSEKEDAKGAIAALVGRMSVDANRSLGARNRVALLLPPPVVLQRWQYCRE